jgi:hypothetical protein
MGAILAHERRPGFRFAPSRPTEYSMLAVGSRRTSRTRPLLWYLASRVLVLVVAAVVVALRNDVSAGRLVSAWDAGYFLDLVRHGYPEVVPLRDGHAAASSLAFFPLFPLCARVLTVLLRLPPAAAAMAVSLAFGAVSVVLFHHLGRLLTDERTADRATLLFCFFPGSVVFSIGYSESLMIALALGCLLALLRERWVLAGVAAALATATRPTGVALVAACLWAAAVAVHRRRDWRALVAPLLAPLGALSFFAYLRWHTGQSGVWFRVQREGWRQTFDFGANTAKLLGNFVFDPLGDGRRLESVVLLGFVLAAVAVFVARRWPGPVVVYTLVVVGLSVATTIDVVRPRAILTAFPLFLALGLEARRPAWVGTLATFAGGLVLLIAFPFFASP